MGLMDLIFKAVDSSYQGSPWAGSYVHSVKHGDRAGAKESRRRWTDDAELGYRGASHLGYERSASWSAERTADLYGQRQEEYRESGGGGFWW